MLFKLVFNYVSLQSNFPRTNLQFIYISFLYCKCACKIPAGTLIQKYLIIAVRLSQVHSWGSYADLR